MRLLAFYTLVPGESFTWKSLAIEKKINDSYSSSYMGFATNVWLYPRFVSSSSDMAFPAMTCVYVSDMLLLTSTINRRQTPHFNSILFLVRRLDPGDCLRHGCLCRLQRLQRLLLRGWTAINPLNCVGEAREH